MNNDKNCSERKSKSGFIIRIFNPQVLVLECDNTEQFYNVLGNNQVGYYQTHCNVNSTDILGFELRVVKKQSDKNTYFQFFNSQNVNRHLKIKIYVF